MSDDMEKCVADLEAQFPGFAWTNSLRELIRIAWLDGQRHQLEKNDDLS